MSISSVSLVQRRSEYLTLEHPKLEYPKPGPSPAAGCIPHPAGSPLKEAARQLAQLNRQYLALKAIDGGLPDDLLGLKCSLSDSALADLADCRFSLFTLGFEDRWRWLDVCTNLDTESAKQATARSGSSEREDFAMTVVFFAWHLASSDPLAARVLLELGANEANCLRRIPIAQLRGVALKAADLLAPRWAQNRFFWSMLLDNSPRAPGAAKRATKLLGRQLLAAQSLGSAFASVDTEDHHSTRRLRRRKRGADCLTVELRSKPVATS